MQSNLTCADVTFLMAWALNPSPRCSALLRNGIKVTQRSRCFNMPGEESQWMVFSNVGRDFLLSRHTVYLVASLHNLDLDFVYCHSGLCWAVVIS